jgi:ribonuclease HII
LKKSAKLRPQLKLSEEQVCQEQGYHLVAGVDEVGRGCLAGPVVASAVIMRRDICPSWYRRVRDSKQLTPEQRDELSGRIHESAISVGTGLVESFLIDQLGMTAAVNLAMRQAISRLLPLPQYILIDYLTIPGLKFPQKGVRDGDSLCFSIACASIVAKVYRDKLLQELDKRYPGYGLARHKGYCTHEHLECLRKLGPSEIHRRLFGPVKNILQLSFDDLQKLQQEMEQDDS